MTGVLFVCLGNICRSATAEGVFRRMIADRGLEESLTVDSCGTSNFHVGSPPDARMAAAARRRGVELAGRARTVRRSDFQDFDRILAMDRSNVADLGRICPRGELHRIGLLRDYDFDGAPLDVPDPYYELNFDEVFEIIERCCGRLAEEMAAEVAAR